MLSRRRFLQTAALASAAAAGPLRAADLALAQAMDDAVPAGIAFDPRPFTLGVASGDPLPDSVILWTRLADDPLRGGMPEGTGTIEVTWRIAADPQMRLVVQGGTVPAQPHMGHSVHVDVRGLDPETTYFYDFTAGGTTSRVGRTRTAPAPGSTSPLRFAFVSCQNFGAGQYAAYRGVAEERPDFVVHLGDYMYESGGPAARSDRGEVGPQPSTLVTYRNRYAQYKGDAMLKRAHAAAPFIVTWDDHEVDNNYRGLVPQDRNAAEGNDTVEAFTARRQAAYQAWYEHMPIRVPDGLPAGGGFRIHRTLRFGDVLDLSMIDTRQYGDDQAPVELPVVTADHDAADRTLLGLEQRAWLHGELANAGRATAWHAIGNQVQIHPIKFAGIPEPIGALLRDNLGGTNPFATTIGLNGDSWEGYQEERRRLLAHIGDNDIPGVVVMTGDIHTHWVAELAADINNPVDTPVATEFVGTSVTSSGLPDGTNAAVRAALLPSNPQIRYYEGEQHGYAVVEVDRDVWRTRYKVVDDLADPGSPVRSLATFEVSRGSARVRQVGGLGMGAP